MAYSKDDLELIEVLNNRVTAGDNAMRFKESENWRWFSKTILEAFFEQGVSVLQNAKTDMDRMKAQQMILAARKPESIIDDLISQGQAAQAELNQFSHQKQEAENNG